MKLTEHQYNWTWSGYNPVAAGWESCPPGLCFGPGVRETYTVHYIISGTGTFSIRGNEYRLHAGQVFAFSPYEVVRYQADQHDPWSYIWINFVITGQVPYRFEQPITDAPFLQPIFEEIRDYPYHSTTGRDFTAGCLYRIGEALSLHQSKTASLVEHAIQFIHRSYNNENLSIAELASKLGVSRYTLSDAFTKIKGVSPLEYLVRYRLEKACEFMTHQQLPPSVAAYSVGYKNYDQFGKIFKKYYGVSPRVYQQQLEAKNR